MSSKVGDRSVPLQRRSFRASRTLHVGCTFAFGKLSQLFPGVVVKLEDDVDDPEAIAFADDDGEVHVFSLSSNAKRGLIEKMTGGVAVAKVFPEGLFDKGVRG